MLSTLFSFFKQGFSLYPTLTTLTFSLLFFTLTIYLSAPPRRFPINAPTLPSSSKEQKKRWRWNSDTMLLEAYKQFPDQVFQIWTSEGPEIIIPPVFVDELKVLPDTVLSATEGMAEMFQSRHTTIPVEENHFGIHFTKTILTKNMSKVLPGMIEELDFVFPQHFQSYPDWTPIEPNLKFIPMITSLVARVFVGPTLCRLPSWLHTSESYSKDIFIASSILKVFPSFSRSLLKNLIPQIWSIRRHNREAAKIVEEALRAKLNNEGEKGESDFENSRDATHGIWELLPDDLKRDYDFQGRGQLGLAAAGIHTSARLLTHVVYSLAQYPEYTSMLRREIEDVRAKMGDDTEWTVEMLRRLKKLDSFMKETMRLYSGGVTSFRRKVLTPTTLSNGLVLPAGSYISAPLCAIAISPENYPSPTPFDGLRFYNLSDSETSAGSNVNINRHQLTSIASTSLAFGIGKHACPGRFFAAVKAKLVLVELLERYEFMLKEKEGRPGEVVFNSLRVVKKGGEVLIRDLKCLRYEVK
ncbi:cytochrome P450 [Rhexocercosporidium sp. MPI-PUGE-AT-0058]|nr:cytochrome P450 [Rhexocercosporidium sp. MPI-PUGE-AT-0058]